MQRRCFGSAEALVEDGSLGVVQLSFHLQFSVAMRLCADVVVGCPLQAMERFEKSHCLQSQSRQSRPSMVLHLHGAKDPQ